MSTGSADPTPLLTPPNEPAVGFRQGLVVAFDQTTGANAIQVGGGIVNDLPMLNSLDALSMQPGDVVGILTSGPSWFLLGRIATVGSPNLFRVLSSIFTVAVDASAGGTSSITYGDLTAPPSAPGPAVTINVGPSGRALCLFSCESEWGSPVPTGVGAHMSVAVSGSTTIAASDSWARQLSSNPVNESVRHQVANFHLFEGLTPGPTTFTMQYRTRSPGGGAQPACTFKEREIIAIGL